MFLLAKLTILRLTLAHAAKQEFTERDFKRFVMVKLQNKSSLSEAVSTS
jgi:hypothetical protein